VAGVLLTAIKWAFLPSVPCRRVPRHRVRHLRLRLHLRLHPAAGHATVAELWLRWGKLAAFRRSRRARPSLSFWERLLSPATAYCILIGRTAATKFRSCILRPSSPGRRADFHGYRKCVRILA
jgi:hypothetical protein